MFFEIIITIQESSIYFNGDDLHINGFMQKRQGCQGGIHRFIDVEGHKNANQIHGHWLDLVITRSTYDNIQMRTVSDGLSDHHTVVVDVTFSITLVQSRHSVSYISTHKIDIDAFNAVIPKPDLIRDPKGHHFV